MPRKNLRNKKAMSENPNQARVRKGKAFAPGYKGKGMCGLCFCSDRREKPGFVDKRKYLYCSWYANWCGLVCRNCKENK